MVDVVSRRCSANGCLKRPLYGFEGEQATFCAAHKIPGQVDRKSKRCLHTDCCTVPSYAFDGQKAQFCINHAQKGMVNVVSSRCLSVGCTVRASFALQRGQRPSYCAKHRQESMVDVRSRQCEEPGCHRQPSYGEHGEKPTYCSLHRAPGMVDVKNRRVPDLEDLVHPKRLKVMAPGLQGEADYTSPVRPRTSLDMGEITHSPTSHRDKLIPRQIHSHAQSPFHGLKVSLTLSSNSDVHGDFRWHSLNCGEELHEQTIDEQIDKLLEEPEPTSLEEELLRDSSTSSLATYTSSMVHNYLLHTGSPTLDNVIGLSVLAGAASILGEDVQKELGHQHLQQQYWQQQQEQKQHEQKQHHHQQQQQQQQQGEQPEEEGLLCRSAAPRTILM
jgi:hypothetical protein